MLNDTRDFSVLVGKTVEAVDSESINSLQLSFTDGSVYQVMAEERHCGIEVFTIEEVKARREFRELNVYRIKNDVYGNPRYVISARALLSRSESQCFFWGD